MRLKNYNGSIKTVSEVIATVEFRHTFNGSKRRLLEQCKDSTVKPNALVFLFEDKGQSCGMFQPFGSCAEDRILLGNLTAEKAEEIVDALLKDGYADISKLKLQKQQFIPEKYIMDDGASDAYVFSTNCPNMIFTNMNSMGSIFDPNCSGIDSVDEDDCGEFGEDGADE